MLSNYWVLIIAFIGSAVFAVLNVFGFDTTTSAAAVAYFIPFFLLLIMQFMYDARSYSRRSVSDEKTAQVKRLVSSIIQFLGWALTLAGVFNLDIPFVEQIRNALGYLSQNIDIAANALLALGGIVVTVIGFFKGPDTAIENKVIHGKKLNI
jgi:amino acid transporter